jgi:hypothetical protein
MQLKSIDTISDKVLDRLLEKYGSDPDYRFNDDRKNLSFGKPREYFLFSNHTGRARLEWTFIWIKGGLWQFHYLNTECDNGEERWVDPLELLNSLL